MVFVVIPAHNEEKTIGRVLGDLFDQGYKNIIVVDDGSSDNTGAIAESAGAIVIRHEINRGQGAALQTGNEFALAKGAEIVVHFDADGQFNCEDIAGAIDMLKKNTVDVILGSRFIDNRSRVPWTKKHVILPISRLINRFLTGAKLTDAHNGFRVLTKKAANTIIIGQDRMAHNTEIVCQIIKNRLSYAEYPVEITYLEYGQGIGGGVKILTDLLLQKLLK